MEPAPERTQRAAPPRRSKAPPRKTAAQQAIERAEAAWADAEDAREEAAEFLLRLRAGPSAGRAGLAREAAAEAVLLAAELRGYLLALAELNPEDAGWAMWADLYGTREACGDALGRAVAGVASKARGLCSAACHLAGAPLPRGSAVRGAVAAADAVAAQAESVLRRWDLDSYCREPPVDAAYVPALDHRRLLAALEAGDAAPR